MRDRRFGWLLLAVLFVAGWAGTTTAAVITGRVVAVADGDTITVLVGGHRQVKIRLADVDTPEKKQPWGKRSKQATSSLVFGRQVTVQVLKKDRYGRSVGRPGHGRRKERRPRAGPHRQCVGVSHILA